MNTFDRLRASAAIAAAAAAVLMTHVGPAFAEDAPGPEELAALQSARPALRLPTAALEAAASYHRYMQSAGDISAAFDGGPAVARSVREGAAYEPKTMSRGAVAYAAVIALQDPDFVRGGRTAAAAAPSTEAFVTGLLAEPYRSSVLPGARSAAARIAGGLGAEGGRVRETGRRVKQAAYDVQHQAWSKAQVADRVERLAEVKTLSLTSPEGPQAALLEVVDAEPAPARRTSAVDRALALAALAVLDEGERGEPLLDDPECSTCLRMAKLNLFQCLAVAKPWYEDVFCLGQHVLIDTGDCIQLASGLETAPLLVARRRKDEDRTLAALH